MKKFLIFFVCAIMLLSANLVNYLYTNADSASTNLIANPSVETVDPGNSSLPQDWTTGSWGTNTTKFSYLTSGAHTGSRSLQVSMSSYTSGDAKWYFTPVAITGGDQYQFNDYYESTTSTELIAQFSDASGNLTYEDLGPVNAASAWTQSAVTFTAPSSATNVTIFHLIQSVGTLTTDDFSLTTAPVVTPPPVGTNLVANDSVESANGNTPADWQDSSWGTNTTAFTYLTTGHTGSRSLQIKTTKYTDGDAKWFFDPVSITPGATYSFSDYYEGTIATQAVAAITLNTGATQYITLGAPAVSSGWTQYSANFVAPAGAVSATVYHLIAGVGTLTTDDFSLTQDPAVAPPTATNLIANPSFETPAGNVPADWQSASWGTNTTKFTYLTTGHTGSRSVEVQTTKYTDGDAKWYFNPVAVTPDTQYQFSDYYKSTIATEVDVAFTMNDGSTVYQIIGLPGVASTWTQFNTTFTVPQGAQTMTIYHLIAGVGTLTTDDFSLAPYTPVGFSRPLVTLTFDDGYAPTYTNAIPLLKQDNFPSTQFIITDLVGQKGYMTIAQLEAMVKDGEEIASHTVTHDDMLTESSSQVKTELAESQQQLETWTGQPVTDMAFPNGLYNSSIVSQTKQYYQGARGVEDGLNSKDNLNPYDIKVQNIYDTTTTAQVADWIKQAQATNTWLVIVYHSVDANPDPNTDAGIYNITPTQFQAQMAALKSSGVTVETMQKALAEVSAQVK